VGEVDWGWGQCIVRVGGRWRVGFGQARGHDRQCLFLPLNSVGGLPMGFLEAVVLTAIVSDQTVTASGSIHRRPLWRFIGTGAHGPALLGPSKYFEVLGTPHIAASIRSGRLEGTSKRHEPKAATIVACSPVLFLCRISVQAEVCASQSSQSNPKPST